MKTDVDAKIERLELFTKVKLTEEQKDVCRNFNNDLVVFADPGTGKTMTLNYGILIAQMEYKIPGSKILCMSFTKAATYEIASRYSKICKMMGRTSDVEFRTFHSMGRTILSDIYKDIRTTKRDKAAACKIGLEIATKNNLDDISEENIGDIVSAISRFNAKGITDEETLVYKKEFKELGIKFDSYDKIREGMFAYGDYFREIPIGDIPYYAIYQLYKHPEYVEKFKNKYELIVVDEFQDMSFIYLILLNTIAKRCIVIGDMKQQIYAFNGSSEDIVRQFIKMRKDPKELKLTQSFRCLNNIANYASGIIKNNQLEEYTPFKGVADGGSVNVINEVDFDYNRVYDELEKAKADKKFGSHMFLFRNNSTSLKIIDQLYERKIPIITDYNETGRETDGYKSVLEQTMIKDLAKIVECCKNKEDMSLLNFQLKKLPEFKDVTDPILPIIQMYKKDPEQAKKMKVTDTTRNFMVDRISMHNMILHNEPLINLLQRAYEMLKKYYHYGRYYDNYLEFSPEYYFKLIKDVIKFYTYDEVVEREADKKMFINNCNHSMIGVKCMTIHKAKGLEANNVYVFDYDNSYMPNLSSIIKLADAGYTRDAAEEIRSERNLAFVAATRAIENLTLIYYDEVSAFDTEARGMNIFSSYDDLYKRDFSKTVNRTVKIGNLVISENEDKQANSELKELI